MTPKALPSLLLLSVWENPLEYKGLHVKQTQALERKSHDGISGSVWRLAEKNRLKPLSFPFGAFMV